MIALSLQLYLHASFGCRGVSRVLRLLAGYLPLGVPASTTVLNWCYRLGLAVLQRPLPRRDDWIFVIDHTVALGAQKCLVVLGIPASRLAETGYSPHHCDMTVLAVEVTAKSTCIWVAAVLERVSTRAGVPVQIVWTMAATCARVSRCFANRRRAAWRPTTSPMPSPRN